MIFRPVMTLKEAQEEDDAKEIRRFAIEKELQEKGLPIKTPMGYEEERKAAPLKHLRHKTKKLLIIGGCIGRDLGGLMRRRKGVSKVGLQLCGRVEILFGRPL
jgi:hypothetical protein